MSVRYTMVVLGSVVFSVTSAVLLLMRVVNEERFLFYFQGFFWYTFLIMLVFVFFAVLPFIRRLLEYGSTCSRIHAFWWVTIGARIVLIASISCLLILGKMEYMPEYAEWMLFFLMLLSGLYLLIVEHEAISSFFAVAQPKTASGNQHGERRYIAYFLLAGIFLIGLLLRVLYLDSLPPYTDEYYHLVAVRQLLDGADWGSVYQRSFHAVTLPIYFFYTVFEPSLFIARLPGAIMGALAVIPMFFLLQRINKWVGLLGALFFAINPWAVEVSRHVREYAVHPVVFLTTATVMYYLLLQIPKKLTLARVLQYIWSFRGSLTLIAISLPLYFVVFIDRLSTMRLIVVVYIVAVLYIGTRFNYDDKLTRRTVLPAAIIGCMVFLFTVMFTNIHYAVHFSPRWLSLFFSADLPQQLYFGQSQLAITGLFILCGASIYLLRRHYLALLSAPFIVSIIFFVFHFNRYFRQRYISSVESWFTIIIVLAIYIVAVLVWPNAQKKYIHGALVIGISALLINPHHIIAPVLNQGADVTSPISGEFHTNILPAFEYVKENTRIGDVYIAPSLTYMYQQAWHPGLFAHSYYYNYKELMSRNLIVATITSYDSGWLVVDASRHEGIFPKYQFTLHGTNIQYKKIGRIHIYRWDKTGNEGGVERDRRKALVYMLKEATNYEE